MKIKVSTKLLLSYISILFIVVVITIIGFNSSMTKTIRNQAYEQLKKQSEDIINFLYEEMPLFDSAIYPFRRELLNQVKLQIAGNLIDSDFILLDSKYNIVHQSVNQLSRNELIYLLNQDRYYGNYMKVTTIIENHGQPIAYLILFTRMNQIDQLRMSFMGTLLISFMIGGVVAFIIGILMRKNILKPLKSLERQMNTISQDTKQKLQPVLTGDEFQELYKVFENMVKQININEETRRLFFQNASHELKTPLMSIQGYAEAIKDGIIEEDEIDSSLDIIISQSQKLKKIVEEMIYLTNLEVDRVQKDLELAPISNGIQEAVLAIKQIADERKVAILWDQSIDAVVLQDEDMLIRVFTNILSNALRYAQSKIEIRMILKGKKVGIQIEDDGCGLKEGEEQKVFERFYKGDRGGTGLGLAISHSIIETHRGNIIAYNNQLGGATFEITLPMTEAIVKGE